jgi:hypothetical protein
MTVMTSVNAHKRAKTRIKKAARESGFFVPSSWDQFEAALAASEAASGAEAASEATASGAEAAASGAEATSEAASEAATGASSAFLPQAARAMAAISEASRSDFFMLVSSKGCQ